MDQVCTVALMRHGGSHLIRPIVAELGFKILEPGNFGSKIDEAQGPVIVWLRDPRDRMVSTLRWWKNKPRKNEVLNMVGETDDEKLAWMLGKGGFLEEMIQWAEIWCQWPGSLKIRFEDVRRFGPKALVPILNHLKIQHDPQMIFDKVFEKGRTFTGKYSYWPEYFGQKSLDKWINGKGPLLMELMEY